MLFEALWFLAAALLELLRIRVGDHQFVVTFVVLKKKGPMERKHPSLFL